jgi:hypothetical protein
MDCVRVACLNGSVSDVIHMPSAITACKVLAGSNHRILCISIPGIPFYEMIHLFSRLETALHALGHLSPPHH